MKKWLAQHWAFLASTPFMAFDVALGVRWFNESGFTADVDFGAPEFAFVLALSTLTMGAFLYAEFRPRLPSNRLRRLRPMIDSVIMLIEGVDGAIAFLPVTERVHLDRRLNELAVKLPRLRVHGLPNPDGSGGDLRVLLPYLATLSAYASVGDIRQARALRSV